MVSHFRHHRVCMRVARIPRPVAGDVCLRISYEKKHRPAASPESPSPSTEPGQLNRPPTAFWVTGLDRRCRRRRQSAPKRGGATIGPSVSSPGQSRTDGRNRALMRTMDRYWSVHKTVTPDDVEKGHIIVPMYDTHGTSPHIGGRFPVSKSSRWVARFLALEMARALNLFVQ